MSRDKQICASEGAKSEKVTIQTFDNYYINTISSILNVINAKEGATVSGKNNIIIHYRFVCNSMQF